MTRKINKSDVVLLVPKKHWRQLKEQLDLIVQEDEQNNGTEWREIVAAIERVPDKMAKGILTWLSRD